MGNPGQRAIDCILSHSIVPEIDASTNPGDSSRFDVRNQIYKCRLCFAAIRGTESNIVKFAYSEIEHSLAMDNYTLINPQLTGHRAIANMPLSWNPRIVPPSQHPMHAPEIADERDLSRPYNEDLDDDPNQFDY